MRFGHHNLAQRRADADSIVRLCPGSGDRGLNYRDDWRIADLLETGDIAAVDTELSAYAGPAQDLRQPFHLWYVARGKAMRATLVRTVRGGRPPDRPGPRSCYQRRKPK
ncbi:MAG: hypothetical protein U0531_13655 [Dehalococcoidia bacterium]